MKDDALRLEQSYSDLLKTDGSGFDHSDEELRVSSMCYLFDVVIAAPTLADHIDRLDEVFDCMKRARLNCKPSKCEINKGLNQLPGRMVDRHGVRPDPEAVEPVLTWKDPTTDTQLVSFLLFAIY